MQNGWMPAVGILASWSESQQQWHCGIPPPEISLGNISNLHVHGIIACTRKPTGTPGFSVLLPGLLLFHIIPRHQIAGSHPGEIPKFRYRQAMAQQSLTPRQADFHPEVDKRW